MNHDILARLYYSSVYPSVASSGILLIQSQVSTSLVQESSTVVYALLWRTCLQRIFQVFSQLMAITLYMLEEIVRSSFTGRGDPSEMYSCTSLLTKTNHDKQQSNYKASNYTEQNSHKLSSCAFFADNFREFATLD